MSNLVYYTVGFSSKYIDLLQFSVMTLRRKNGVDVLVICDEALVDQCTEKLSMFENVLVVPCTDSTSAMDSSMKKLRIFDYDISKYEKVLFIDSDIIVDIELDTILNNVRARTKLYAFAEHRTMGFHAAKYHSLMNYTFEDYAFFDSHKIFPFNCGLFAFVKTSVMKDHFSSVLEMIETYDGTEYWYEQSFMNVYFNKLNLVDTNVINTSNCLMNIDISKLNDTPNFSWKGLSNKNKFFHFCYARGADQKFSEMKFWFNKYIR